VIHDENPFVEAPDQRDPVRRFRGRLTAPVTIVTSGSGGNRTGLTVSSLFVIEGSPGIVQLVAGPTSDLWSAIQETGRFVVHVCRDADRDLAEVFAGLRPSPGGVFAGLATTDTEDGPVIERLGDRAFCSGADLVEVGYSGIVTAEIERTEAGDLVDPLIYFRGRYRSLG
jgi:flavin reductase (DIM6/NTAB) family NADH-FMN oxidoreductase RutF